MGIYNHREHVKTSQFKNATDKSQHGERKLKGWLTPYGFCDFGEPVTYQEACDQMKEIYDKIMKEKQNDR